MAIEKVLTLDGKLVLDTGGSVLINRALTREWLWATNSSSSTTSAGKDIGLDNAGNCYSVGSFQGSANFGGIIVSGSGQLGYIGKVNAETGEWFWVSTVRNGFCSIGSIVTDPDGNSIVAGEISVSGTTVFGDNEFTLTGYANFIGKINTAGEWQWVVGYGSSGTYCRDLVVDSSGSCYLIGHYTSPFSLGGITLPASQGSSDIFAAKLSTSDFSWQWAVTAGGSDPNYGDYGWGIALDSSNDCYVIGDYRAEISFGGTTLPSGGGGNNMFVAKINNASGSWAWAVAVGDTNYTTAGRSIAIDSSDNIFVSGSFRGNVSFGSTSMSSIAFGNGYIAQINTLGQWQWAMNIPSTTDALVASIRVDSSGNIFAAGYFRQITLGSIALSSASPATNDVFIAKYSSGAWQWAAQGGGINQDYGNQLIIDDSENCYLTGSYSTSATFGTHQLSGATSDMFLAKYGIAY